MDYDKVEIYHSDSRFFKTQIRIQPKYAVGVQYFSIIYYLESYDPFQVFLYRLLISKREATKKVPSLVVRPLRGLMGEA